MPRLTVFQTLLFVLVTGQSVSQEIRSLDMTIMDGWQLTCASTTCLPFVIADTQDVQQCQATCLSRIECQVATFQRSTSACALFAYRVDAMVNLSPDPYTITSIAEMGTRIPAGQYEYILV